MLFTAQCTFFVTAVNELEFCETHMSKLSQYSYTTIDI